MLKRLLVANRGEIAVRVIRAARELGVRTVAVASEADRDSMHAQLADECVLVGPAEAARSYLDPDAVLRAAAETGCDSVHPGYGFLSERASFARACREAGLVFVGPPAEAMERLGAKIDAKALAQECGIPLVPGFFEPGADDARLEQEAAKIGYPVMLKASAGGGGRGMRVVRDPAGFRREAETAREEALKGFGDGAMMVERLVERPRHVEVQFLADAGGEVACLFERECSVQRRHQKLLEESPSPLMSEELWSAMREATSKLARAAGYTNAGTAEFMVDPRTGDYFFLEVNARLQVEHPVTESVTGVDLVQWQLRIASGERLGLAPALMEGRREALRGCSVEARIVAEDPARAFLPSTGKILGWAPPSGPGIRFDTGYRGGDEVTRHYDSLLAKLIVWAEDRPAALRRLEAALLDTHILGVATNVGYLLDVVRHPVFASGAADTGFVDREMEGWAPDAAVPGELGSLVLAASPGTSSQAVAGPQGDPAWSASDGFRVLRP